MTVRDVAIIGAGLAGTACAYVLKQAGLNPIIYEAGPTIAPGASGNPLGLYNPRLSAERNPESEYFSKAFMLALETFAKLEEVGWHQCGALHLINDEKKETRFPQTLANWGWPDGKMQLLNAAQASEVAGLDLQYGALYLPDAGCVSPHKLCVSYAHGIEIHVNSPVRSLADIKADALIIACGMGSLGFAETRHLPFKAVRGQITQARASADSAKLKTNLCYGGYCSPAIEGVHTIGATFQRWLDHSDLIEQDDADNLAGLFEITPVLGENPQVVNRRAAVRATAPDHFPVTGKIPGHERLYISAAHGSHGILSALMSAHLLADMLTKSPARLPVNTIEKLSPARFSSVI